MSCSLLRCGGAYRSDDPHGLIVRALEMPLTELLREPRDGQPFFLALGTIERFPLPGVFAVQDALRQRAG